jgi:hypothetical protein
MRAGPPGLPSAGVLLCGLPRFALVSGRRLARRGRARQLVDHARMADAGVWRGRHGRSDAMAAAIAGRADRLAGSLDPTIQLADPGRPENRHRGRRNMLIALAVYLTIVVVQHLALR